MSYDGIDPLKFLPHGAVKCPCGGCNDYIVSIDNRLYPIEWRQALRGEAYFLGFSTPLCIWKLRSHTASYYWVVIGYDSSHEFANSFQVET